MKLTKNEFGNINFALLTTGQTSQSGQNVGRTFQANELQKAIDVFSKIEKNSKDGKFVDGECDFGTDEKVFILRLLERPWSLQDGKIKIELEKKLK